MLWLPRTFVGMSLIVWPIPAEDPLPPTSQTLDLSGQCLSYRSQRHLSDDALFDIEVRRNSSTLIASSRCSMAFAVSSYASDARPSSSALIARPNNSYACTRNPVTGMSFLALAHHPCLIEIRLSVNTLMRCFASVIVSVELAIIVLTSTMASRDRAIIAVSDKDRAIS